MKIRSKIPSSFSSIRYSRFEIQYSRFFFLFSLLLLFSRSLHAQEWSEPMNITNLGGFSEDPDIVNDNSGIIHIVFSYEINFWYRKIMYIYSEDDGNTWTAPLDLLQNTDLWMSQPHIACDSKNNLYVTYDYATGTADKLVYLIVYDGHQWGEPILVSEGMPRSDYNKIITDNNDQIFLGWYRDGKFYYRYYCNHIFSEIYCPYLNEEDKYLPVEGALTNDQEIHWVGSSASVNYYGARLQYYLFDISNNSWTEPQMPVQDTVTEGKGIALNIGNLPECVYRTYPSPDDKTKHTQKEGNYWSDPELVAGVDGTQKYQQIAVDQNNDVHIVERQGTTGSQRLVHYKKKDNNWVGQYIDTCYVIAYPKLLFKDNKLYCVYEKAWEVGKEVDSDVFFSKYDIVTNINEETRQTRELKIYPNPGSDNIYIEFENDKQQQIDLSIFDMNGKYLITLISETKPQGVCRQLWNGTDKKGKQVSAGQYLVRLKLGRNTTTGLVEIIK